MGAIVYPSTRSSAARLQQQQMMAMQGNSVNSFEIAQAQYVNAMRMQTDRMLNEIHQHQNLQLMAIRQAHMAQKYGTSPKYNMAASGIPPAKFKFPN